MDDELRTEVVHDPYANSVPGELGSLLWAYPVISLLLMAVNLFFIVHALRTGRPFYWVWIIFAMPVLGAAAYLLVEVRPRWKFDWKNLRRQFESPKARISRLLQIAEDSPTVKNKWNAAREYESHNQWNEAVAIYRSCLSGVFADDPRLQICLATALLEADQVEQALSIAEKIAVQRDPILEDDRKLIVYRAQSARGDSLTAIEGLVALATRTSSLGPRYYLACAQEIAGEYDDSVDELNGILKRFQAGNALFRKSEEVWYLKAKRRLKNTNHTQARMS